MIDELSAYLLEHARREELILVSHPVITFHTDERLALGEFGYPGTVGPPGRSRRTTCPLRREPDRRRTRRDDDLQHLRAPARPGFRGALRRARAQRALLGVGGRRMLIPPAGGTIGAAATAMSCSRTSGSPAATPRSVRRPAAGRSPISDSTNGVSVNGRPRRRRAASCSPAIAWSSARRRSCSNSDDDAGARIGCPQVRLPCRPLSLSAVGRAQRRAGICAAAACPPVQPRQASVAQAPPDATGMYSASTLGSADVANRAPRLVVERRPVTIPG